MFTYVPIHSGSATDQPLGWSSPELKSTAGKNPLETTSFTSTYRVSCQINKNICILPSLESWLARILWAYARITSVDHQWVGKHMSAGRLLLPQGVYWDHHPVSMCWSNPNSTYRHLQTTDYLQFWDHQRLSSARFGSTEKSWKINTKTYYIEVTLWFLVDFFIFFP
jgi:hypothetical protein